MTLTCSLSDRFRAACSPRFLVGVPLLLMTAACSEGGPAATGNPSASGSAGMAGASSAGSGSGGAAGSGGSAGAGALDDFGFFVTSMAAMIDLSGNPEGFGGDLSYNGQAGVLCFASMR